MGIPRIFSIRESNHRIHNPITEDKYVALGEALALTPRTRILDLACGSGEMLCLWARDHQITGTGVDLCEGFVKGARARAVELGVDSFVQFTHSNAAGYVTNEAVDIAACVGATWIEGGVAGTIDLLSHSLRPGGIMLIGEPYWLQTPPSQEAIEGCGASDIDDFAALPDLIGQFGELGYDTVEMMLADQDTWDRYQAPQWLNLRRWLDQNPDDELAPTVRYELTTGPADYARFTREYVGWGVFALMRR